jgi:glycosyltransferase involved in cell wall biosynthesis
MTPSTILIHQAFASKNEPGGTRHYELGRRLVAQGHEFTVVASDVSYHTGKRLVPKARLKTESFEDGIRVLRAFTYSGVHKSYFLRIISFLSFMTTSVVVGVGAGVPDVVMGTTPPIFQAFSAWMLSRLRRRPFLLEVRDLWPEFAIDIGILKNHALIRMARFLEQFLYDRADHLLVNSPAYRDYLIDKGVKSDKISLVPNGVDFRMFDPEDRGDLFRKEYKLEGMFVVTYAGAIGMANNIETVLQAAEELKLRDDIHILIVGDGKERERLENESKGMKLTNLTFTGSFPKSQMATILAASDACIAVLKDIPMFTTTYPNKVFDYMAAGRPTILAIDGVIRQVIEAANGGVFVKPGNPRSMAEAIIGLANCPERARALGRSARAYVIEHFSRDEHARQFANLISRVASQDFVN